MSSFTSLPGHVALAAVLALGAIGAAQAQVVTRDAQTGQMRAPTAAEAKALEAAANRSAQPKGLITGRTNPTPVRQANGTLEQELDTSTLMYSVARKNPDGTVSQYCVTGAEAADRILKGPAVSRAPVVSRAAKEQNYEVK